MSSTSSPREAALTAAFVDMADTMAADYDVVDLLHRLAGHCVDLLGVTAAGVLVTDAQGQPQPLATNAQLVELLELQVDQRGPCVDCFDTGEPVSAVDLSQYSGQWPRFVAEAQRQMFHTVHALPMRLRDQTVGVLNLFRTDLTRLSTEDLALGQALADIATISILHERALHRSQTHVEQLQAALDSRIVIEQAKGALAQHGGLDVDDAFTLLRNYARSHRLPLSQVARDVVTNRQSAAAVLAPRT